MPDLSPEQAAAFTSDERLQRLWTSWGLTPWNAEVDPEKRRKVQREWTGLHVPNGGAIPGIAVGSWFKDRAALQEAKVHRPGQAGICGKALVGAESIVVSGGYPEDEDHGDWMIYTGQGGRKRNETVQTFDQPMTLGNAALVTSYVKNLLVRVIRGSGGDRDFSPSTGLRYDGLFEIERVWSEIGVTGHLVWRYQLRSIPEGDAVVDWDAFELPPPPAKAKPSGNAAPGRKETITKRVIRSTEVAEWVKLAHKNLCQVCGVRLELPLGSYAEAAHIRPLGVPHDGPDQVENVLCLCPNHHVLFDAGALWIDDNLMVIHHLDGPIGPLRIFDEHKIADEWVAYHRGTIAKR